MMINIYGILIVLMSLPLYWVVINLGFGIEGVALITSFSFFLLSIVNIALAEREMKLSVYHRIKTFFSNLIYLIPLAPMIALDLFYGDVRLLELEFYKLGLFIILFSPFAFKIFKNKKIGRVIFSK